MQIKFGARCRVYIVYLHSSHIWRRKAHYLLTVIIRGRNPSSAALGLAPSTVSDGQQI